MTYSYKSITLSNGNTIDYKIIQETAYHSETSDRVVFLLEMARQNKTRLRIFYGDTTSGIAWGDVTVGHIGRSIGGSVSIPLVIHNKRSLGGESLLDHCIVKIEHANKKNGGVLYQHEQFKEWTPYDNL